ncbi:L-histidine N(alpha)-methyltransferase [Trinickia sp. Y13]|uniref:L-histidine N(alpha)-methyltransferase n=1 Tax=Trinickia sp. Y13 TaxID=2917807 RepID=UPI00240493F8|nr:L-histidine N(alpha)-methyltransferase [Trinickia sp. Y13]MDG0024918.1 L-histidine N(alpha)-methyltransferase [Trinickia sp. Y13]
MGAAPPGRPRADLSDSAFCRDLLAGLSRMPRSIAPKYFYDAQGSALFDRICELPEYYPTRTERRILERYGREMAEVIGPQADIIEFGAGSLEKIRFLLQSFEPRTLPRRYFPIDISAAHLKEAARRMHVECPWLEVRPVAADYMNEAQLKGLDAATGRRVGFFPGSTIGNFDEYEAMTFLRLAARLLEGGGLLVGVDLVKDPKTLHQAYNDAQGVTAAFNLNLLRRANTELSADFDVGAFAHYAFYDPHKHRIEMHLVSQCAQTVRVAGESFDFEEGESLHTESSHKFTIEGFRKLAVSAGFRPGPVWTDEARLFSVHWLGSPERGAGAS